MTVASLLETLSLASVILTIISQTGQSPQGDAQPQGELIVPYTTNVTAYLISHNDVLLTSVIYKSLAHVRTMAILSLATPM